MIEIYRKINKEETPVASVPDDNATLERTLMGADEVTLSVTVSEPLDLRVGDYARLERGIYIDERVEIAGENAVLLGACEAECGVEKYAVSRLYVKHDSRVVIWARDHAFVMVDALDNAAVEVHCEGESKVVVNLYARATAVADGDGYAKVVHKNKETYDL